MKRRWIIGLIILAVLFLTGRAIYLTINRLRDERVWYAGELKFEFSLAVDSTKGRSLFCHVTKGDLNPTTESQVNKTLRHHKNLRIFFVIEKSQVRVFNKRAKEMTNGDSLRVSSSHNQITAYRKGIKIIETPLSDSVVGRPF